MYNKSKLNCFVKKVFVTKSHLNIVICIWNGKIVFFQYGNKSVHEDAADMKKH